MYFQLAQINIGELIAPIDDPLVSEFVDNLDAINELAEKSPGFVWRFKDESNSAVNVQLFENPNQIINMSVWEDLDSLKHFAYETKHVEFFKKRALWFKKMKEPHMCFWWIHQGSYPTPEEGIKRLMYFREHGDTEYAFSFKRPYVFGEYGIE